jgi:hypothetical protein
VIPLAFFIGEPVSSPYGAAVLNPSVIPLENNTRNNLHISEPPFFLILNISSVVTDGHNLSVYAHDLTDGLNSVGNGDLKLPTELFRRKFRWY